MSAMATTSGSGSDSGSQNQRSGLSLHGQDFPSAVSVKLYADLSEVVSECSISRDIATL